ncbi:hypothetical protein TRICI_005571 [Trichomonascus ciferrii]|uniref:Uncharacterized protein n=1 Tax=Trichomonascus ciferrii TaxID=44093 RepID=A0A642URL8_9ASCO|nr:hypothetical protein TRICI_005571 [Trichomonascus ciferrii]
MQRRGAGITEVEKEKVLDEFRQSSLRPLTRDTRFAVGEVRQTPNRPTASSEQEKDKKRGKKRKAILKRLPKDREDYSREEKIAIDVMSHLPGSTIKTKPQLQSVIDSLLPGYDPIDVLKALAKLGEELAHQPSQDYLSISSSSHSKY